MKQKQNIENYSEVPQRYTSLFSKQKNYNYKQNKQYTIV